MTTIIYEQVIRLADQLDPAERLALAHHLLATLTTYPAEQVTLEMIQTEHARRRAEGAFDQVESLRNKYANPAFDPTDEELHAGIRAFATEWEQELDEFHGDD
jgi:hypothetical protein